jgi:hypothetical protein
MARLLDIPWLAGIVNDFNLCVASCRVLGEISPWVNGMDSKYKETTMRNRESTTDKRMFIVLGIIDRNPDMIPGDNAKATAMDALNDYKVR